MIPRRKNTFYDGEFSDILNSIFSKNFLKKNYVREFEESFANYIGTKHAIAVSAGRVGMKLLLEALNLKRGDEIMFPAYTLKDLIFIVQNMGLKPVLVDIEKNSFNINPDLIEEKITSKTKAIIATHIFGLPCNIEKVIKIADKHNIYVIEDCCHAHGAEFKSKKVGCFGIGGFFSFNQIKLISTFEGGMITTNDDRISKFVREKVKKFPISENEILKRILLGYLENFILETPLFCVFSNLFFLKSTRELFNKFYISYHQRIRTKYSKYTNLQAFLGLKQLEVLDEKIKMRIKKVKLLKSLLNKKIKLQEERGNYKHVYFYFIVRSNKDSRIIQRKLWKKGLDVGIKEEITDDCTKILNEFHDECPVTHEIFNTAIQIPIHENFTEENIHRIADILNGVLND